MYITAYNSNIPEVQGEKWYTILNARVIHHNETKSLECIATSIVEEIENF